MTFRFLFVGCMVLLAVPLCLPAVVSDEPPADPNALQRAEFQQAYGRVAPSVVGAASDSAALRSYVLYPYLQAARLAHSLRTAGSLVPEALDEQIAKLLLEQDGLPVIRELRRSWMYSLAERAQWSRFVAFHRPASDEPALRCHGFTARIEQQQTTNLAADVAQLWLTPRSVPECDRAFEWMRSGGALDAARIEQRARLALEAGNAAFARQVAQQLPADRVAPLLQWAALLEDPQREIDALVADPQSSVEPAALQAGWTLLARRDRAAAKQRFETVVKSRALDARSTSAFALALALPLSWDRDPESLAYFARVATQQFDDVAREWQARAALWAGDWPQVARSVAALSTQLRASARWRYWAARAAAQRGDEDGARELYKSILPDDNYYSAMSAAHLHRKLQPHAQRVPVDEAQLARIEQLPAITRARELRLSGLGGDAYAEWRLGQDTLAANVLAQAAHLAARWRWFDQAITSATAARVFNDYALLYPHPYDSEVTAAAKSYGLAPEIIYGVIRQESSYRNDAVSAANARGLMQLQIDTARRTARNFKLPAPTEAALTFPAVNIALGAAHLRELLQRFDDQLPLALAAYNAGPNAVRRWLPSAPLDVDIWIENIPYNETRTYVQRILWHGVVFAWLREGKAQDTRGWVSQVKAPPLT